MRVVVNAAALTLIVSLQLRFLAIIVVGLAELVAMVEKFRRLRIGMMSLMVLWAMVP